MTIKFKIVESIVIVVTVPAGCLVPGILLIAMTVIGLVLPFVAIMIVPVKKLKWA